jgi:hypothetical protein
MKRKDLLPRAIELRLRGWSLKQIADELKISKATASVWLRSHPLDPGEIRKRRVASNRRRARDPEEPESKYSEWMVEQKYSTLQIAKISESAVLFRLSIHKFNAFGSVFDGDRTDWLVEIPETGRVWKIQVRTMKRLRHGKPLISLARSGPTHGSRERYQKGEFDFIVGYDVRDDRAYVWSWDEVADLKTTVSASTDAEERWDKLLSEG